MNAHDRRALAHFRPLPSHARGAPGIHPIGGLPIAHVGRGDFPYVPVSVPQPQSWEDYVNFLVSALLELLSAAPALGTDFETAVVNWHNAHGDQAKTAAAVSTATQIIAAAGAIATTLEPVNPANSLQAQPIPDGTYDTGTVKTGGGAIHF